MTNLFFFVASEPNASALFLGNILVASGAMFILLLLIKKLAWKDITKIFEERAQKISNDIDEAEKSREKAKDLVNLREKELQESKKDAQNIIQNAKDSASQTRQNMLCDAEEEVARKKEQATADIEQSKQEAFQGVKKEIADISLVIAQKILNKELSMEAHQEMIEQFAQKLGE